MPQGRSGIGIEEAKKRKLDEEVEREMKRVRVDQDTYRERMRAEREESRNEALVSAAQKVAERLAEVKWQAEHEDAVLEGRVLVPRVANVLWRGKVQRREQQEKEKRLRHDMASNLLRRGSLAREDEDEEEDEDDRIALGKTVQEIEDPDDEDQELEEFEALLAAEKLQRLIDHLRSEHYYCFWCKYQYEDSDMEGCPGKTEEDHD